MLCKISSVLFVCTIVVCFVTYRAISSGIEVDRETTSKDIMNSSGWISTSFICFWNVCTLLME